MEVYVVTGSSESGDDYGPFLFAKKPTDAELKKLIEDKCDAGDWDGPGDFDSYTFLDVKKVTVDK